MEIIILPFEIKEKNFKIASQMQETGFFSNQK